MRYIILLALLFNLIYAQRYALIVGVGEYENSSQSGVAGVEYDIKNAQKLAKYLQIPKSNIAILKDSNATLSKVRDFLKEYINNSQKNSKDNLLFFYFSGHGLQVKDRSGDERDGYDEAMAFYDFNYYNMQDKTFIDSGAMIDDEFYYYLSKIKSFKVLVLDKCNADSSYRGISKNFIKAISGEFNLDDSFYQPISSLKSEKSLNNFVAFSAVDESGLAESSPIGSLFTTALVQGIVYKKAIDKSGKVKIKNLEVFCNLQVREIAKEIHKKFKDVSNINQIQGLFRPIFRPNRLLLENSDINSLFKLSKKESKRDYLLEDLLDSLVSINALNLKISKEEFKLYDKIEINLTSKKDGYLSVLLANKNSYKIFMDNQKINQNREYNFPKSFFKKRVLMALKPFGETKIYFLLSKKELNLKEYIDNMKNKSDDLKVVNYITRCLVPSQELIAKEKDKALNRYNKNNKEIEINRVKFNVVNED